MYFKIYLVMSTEEDDLRLEQQLYLSYIVRKIQLLKYNTEILLHLNTVTLLKQPKSFLEAPDLSSRN